MHSQTLAFIAEIGADNDGCVARFHGVTFCKSAWRPPNWRLIARLGQTTRGPLPVRPPLMVKPWMALRTTRLVEPDQDFATVSRSRPDITSAADMITSAIRV